MNVFREELVRWGIVEATGRLDVADGPALLPMAERAECADALGGPTHQRPAVTLDEAEAYCRELAQSHYENFPLVSWLLPRRLHQHFQNIYAYCRWADDLADEVSDANESLHLLKWWRSELGNCYAGACWHPVFVALHRTIQEFQIPYAPFNDLISAFEQDQTVQEYDTFGELLDYCRRSANPVGRLVLSVCEVTDESSLGWSDSICTGLQLANFWQDVRRDYEMGRIYLPREDRDRFGYEWNDLDRMIINGPFRDLMQFEVDRARTFLQRGLPLIDRLPGRLQVDIELFVRGGLRILNRIERIDYAVLEQRPVVTHSDFVGLFGTCACRALLRRVGLFPVSRLSSSFSCHTERPAR